MYTFGGITLCEVSGLVYPCHRQSGPLHTLTIKDEYRFIVLHRDDTTKTIEVETTIAGQHLYLLVCINKQRVIHIDFHCLRIDGFSRTVSFRIEAVVTHLLKRQFVVVFHECGYLTVEGHDFIHIVAGYLSDLGAGSPADIPITERCSCLEEHIHRCVSLHACAESQLVTSHSLRLVALKFGKHPRCKFPVFRAIACVVCDIHIQVHVNIVLSKHTEALMDVCIVFIPTCKSRTRCLTHTRGAVSTH